MELQRGDSELEQLNQALNDPEALLAYAAPYNNQHISFIPRMLGYLLVWCGNTVYGKKPSYLKFRSVEVIARVPYHSWSSAIYTLLTLCYGNEQKAMQLVNVEKYARLAQDNETMHVVVITLLARREKRAGFIRYTLIPLIFAFFYFWASYILYLINRAYSYQLNYMFEQHAFDQYSEFIETNKEALLHKEVDSEFLTWYGRCPRNQYEFFRSVRNDEIIHRNTSIKEVAGILTT